MAKRVVTITSGKGGVGKTTLAINLGLALSELGRTVLIDHDVETGSVRSFLDLPFTKDLYHFVARDTPLSDCVTQLPDRWDPDGRYSDFGIIAAPRHFIDGFGEMLRTARPRFIQAINDLDAEIVILDMRAGLSDDNVSWMPYSNSGVLVFTPQLPAAAGAAANLIKAQIFRKLHLAVTPPSPVVADLSPSQLGAVAELFDRADDVYDDDVPNLDAVIQLLPEALGDQHHRVVTVVRRTLESFFVHYVLNHFDGIQDSYERAVRPFVEQLAEIVSARLDVRNLGWIERNPEIHEANCRRLPALVYRNRIERSSAERHRRALAEVEAMVAGLEPTEPSGDATAAGVNRYLTDQLKHLERMHEQVGATQYATQLSYLAAAAMHRIRSLRSYSFGDTRLLTQDEVHDMMVRHYASTETA
jgi:MinD-like ATPase involved in chromosome partitioning or flagellar assembly